MFILACVGAVVPITGVPSAGLLSGFVTKAFVQSKPLGPQPWQPSPNSMLSQPLIDFLHGDTCSLLLPAAQGAGRGEAALGTGRRGKEQRTATCTELAIAWLRSRGG